MKPGDPKTTAAPFQWPTRAVSIGGWCGVALTLRRTLGLCREAYPFDYVLSTFAGVIHFLEHGFESFLPEEPVLEHENGRMLFKGAHTIFPHHDLRRPEVSAAFQRRIARLNSLLQHSDEPLLLVRASGAFFDESPYIPLLIDLLSAKFPSLDFRVLYISHFTGRAPLADHPLERVIVRHLPTEDDWESTYPQCVRQALAINDQQGSDPLGP